MTYWDKRRDDYFRIENASVKWNEANAPFHTVGRLPFYRSRSFRWMPPKRHISIGKLDTYITPIGRTGG